ncbi:hypothetical protein ACQKL0_16560 [Peribacillus sp. NPDC097264]|uniref:hypothetical protein n=1 Tax=Peribacillus sp. NPDC097264 TaxID=3390616 RepID=UPI003D0752D2
MLEWLITMGFIGCLALGAGVFVYFVRSGFDSSDISRIDPFLEPEAESESFQESASITEPELESPTEIEPEFKSDAIPRKEE